VAGGGVHLVLEVLGVRDIFSQSMGSNNPFAMVHVTLDALGNLRSYWEECIIALGNSMPLVSGEFVRLSRRSVQRVGGGGTHCPLSDRNKVTNRVKVSISP
jgi:hypothetical protein